MLTAATVVQISLIIVLAATAVSALKLLQRIEAYLPPIAARRIIMSIDRGDDFPWRVLPEKVSRDLVGKQVLMLCFLHSCPLCVSLIPSVRALSRAYRDVAFIVCSDRDLEGLDSASFLVLADKEVHRSLKLTMFPYAIKIDGSRVIDLGIVNTCEQIESVLEAGAI